MEVDYLIVGAGACGMAFLDVILTETDATVAIVDRRDAPGGHWNDAYPYVRLHQSSSFYGVPSRELGQDRVNQRGFNAGLYELASKPEILHYYQELMDNIYLPTGRVQYFPMSEVRDGVIRSLVSGEVTPVKVRRKRVNAGIWGDLTRIPLTHERSFAVAEGVACVPPNDLPHVAGGHDRFSVLGAGKTAMDAVLWLQGRGVAPERITWVRPRDYWLFHRDNSLPHRDRFFETMPRMIQELESLATAPTVAAHCANMEALGRWHRIDPDHWPERFHAAVCSGAEVAALRQVTGVIRAGHVQAIEPDRLVMESSAVPVAPGQLFVDCTASGGAILGPDAPPVFDGETVNLFMIRPFQPLFSAALIGFLEANVSDPEELAECTRVTNFHNTPAEALAEQQIGFLNQNAWNQRPLIKDWIDRCRLNAGSHIVAGMTSEDTDKLALLGQMGPLTAAATQNIPRILAAETV